MAKKRETNFRNNILKPLLEKLPNTWIESIQQVVIRGTPDYILCVNGIFVGLEVKDDDESDIAKLQSYKLEKIRQAGGYGFRVDRTNYKEVLSILYKLAIGGLNVKKE